MFACAFSPDGGSVLSGGWDGHLRLWEVSSGRAVTDLTAAAKAVSACAVSPDGVHWLAGSLDGMLAYFDSRTQQRSLVYLAHTRPVSAIVFDADGQSLATASWDRSLALWKAGTDRDKRPLTGHEDIVAGCRFSPDGRTLLSWSYDATLRLWDALQSRLLARLAGHEDRVTAAAVAPDGAWAVSCGRDGAIKLWDLAQQREAATARVSGEVKSCFFLLDGESLVTVESSGRLLLHSVPALTRQAELALRLPVQCAALAPGGGLVAVGCDDGRVRLVTVEGLDDSALVVTPTRTSRRTTTVLGRLLGKSRLEHCYSCLCPGCRQTFELREAEPGRPRICPHCCRPLRLSAATRVVPDV